MSNVVCNTAKVRFFKQITTLQGLQTHFSRCLQYSKSTIFQANHNLFFGRTPPSKVVCNTAKVRFFKQITTQLHHGLFGIVLFAIQQKYDFSSKSQLALNYHIAVLGCLQYSKSTIFQANHNGLLDVIIFGGVVCNTAKVRFFKQITTPIGKNTWNMGCLQYSKSTIFQANHNGNIVLNLRTELFAIQQKYDFSSKSQLTKPLAVLLHVVCNTAKVRFFKQITTLVVVKFSLMRLFAIQ